MRSVASIAAFTLWLQRARHALSRRAEGGRLVVALAVLASALAAACAAEPPDSAGSEPIGSSASELQGNCGCSKTGGYAAPSLAPPVTSSSSLTVTTSVSPSGTGITLKRRTDGATVFSATAPVPTPSSPLPVAYGFSPDGSHFLYHYVQQGFDYVFLVDVSSGVGRVVYNRTVPAQSVAFQFSPLGRYLVHAYVSGNNVVSLNLVNATSGAGVYSASLQLYTQVVSPPGRTLDVAGWGFASDDESFVSAHVSGQGLVNLNLVNVVRGTLVASRYIASSALWSFSPCADVLGLAEVSRQGDATVNLTRTSDGRNLGTASGRAIPGGVQFSVTSASHQARINQTTYQVAPNTASSTCSPTSGLQSVTVTPSAVTGGDVAKLSVTLGAPPAGVAVVALKSSNPELVRVPPTITLRPPLTTATVTITTSTTRLAADVTLTATLAGVTRSTVLRLKPVLACGGAVCAPASQCQMAGCNARNRCSYAPKPTGTSCDDGNPNTTGDACNDGACIGVDRCASVSCPSDQCRTGACDRVTGTCSYALAPSGTPCDDGNPSTTGDVCAAGTCHGVDLCAGVSCPSDACHAGSCNSATGTCTSSTLPDGTPCDDGDSQTTGDACAAGACVGSPAGCVETNLALNPSGFGFPDPTQSDSGWGGGSYPWQIVDGLHSYDTWASGLAFTGGHYDASGGGPWIEPAGVRHAVIDLGAVRSFDRIVLWWHGAEHTPATGSVEYWDGTDWLSAASVVREYGAEHAEGTNSGYSDSDSYTFAPVTASKVRYTFDNSGLNILGTYNVHGWLFELEVLGCAVPTP